MRFLFVLLTLVTSLSAAIKVGTLNCFFLVDPSRPAEGQLSEKAPPPATYSAKLENLSGLIKGLDVVGIQEVGSAVETQALAKASDYQALFVQGKDTFTGQDVGALVAKRSGLTVKKAARVPALETLSKHLLVTLDADGTRYAVLVVHLLRPLGKNEAKHLVQLAAIRTWAESMKNTAPDTTLVVLGDFNNPSKELLPMHDSAELTGFAPTHLTGKAFDHIFTTGTLGGVEIVRPPLPKRPNETLKALWTDHYLVKAAVSK